MQWGVGAKRIGHGVGVKSIGDGVGVTWLSVTSLGWINRELGKMGLGKRVVE
jgi:hypothetical protein